MWQSQATEVPHPTGVTRWSAGGSRRRPIRSSLGSPTIDNRRRPPSSTFVRMVAYVMEHTITFMQSNVHVSSWVFMITAKWYRVILKKVSLCISSIIKTAYNKNMFAMVRSAQAQRSPKPKLHRAGGRCCRPGRWSLGNPRGRGGARPRTAAGRVRG